MELARSRATSTPACSPTRGSAQSNSGFVNRGGGLVVDTFWDLPAHARMIDLYAARVRSARAAGGQHPPQRRPLLGQPALRRAPRSSATACAPSSSARSSPELLVALCGADDGDDPALDGFARALRRLGLPRHRAHAADDADRRPARPRPRRHRASTCSTSARPTPPATSSCTCPSEGIVFTGDILFRLCTPIGWEGTFAQLDRRARRDRGARAGGRGARVTARSAASRARAGCGEYLEYVARRGRRGLRRRPDARSRRPSASTSGRTPAGPSRSAWPSRSTAPIASCRGEPWDAPSDVGAIMRDMHELVRHWQSGGASACR